MASTIAPPLTTPKTVAPTLAQIQAQYSGLYSLMGDSGRTIQPLQPSLAQWIAIQNAALAMAQTLGLA